MADSCNDAQSYCEQRRQNIPPTVYAGRLLRHALPNIVEMINMNDDNDNLDENISFVEQNNHEVRPIYLMVKQMLN